MIIGFDGRYAEGDLVGVGKYITNLVSQIARKNIKCVVFYSREPKYPIIGKNISLVVLNTNNRYFFEQVKLPKALIQRKVNVFHATGNIGIPIFCSIPSLLTVHDIIPVLIKDYFKNSRYFFLSKMSYLFRLKSSLFRTKKIIVDSEFTKRTLIDNFGIKINKIETIYCGAPEENYQTDKLPLGLKTGEYVLNHGGIDKRKNLVRLIRAFANVNLKIPEIKLVITGENHNLGEELRSITKILKIEKKVLFTGYVEENNLWSLIRQANCICYPSLMEGFGGPVLEGFTAGIPVITTNSSSLPEISGEAAYLVNPENEDEITQAILRVVTDKDLRKELIMRGEKRVKKFSWEKTSQEVISIYKEILER